MKVRILPPTLHTLRGRPGAWTSYHDTTQPGLELRVSPAGVRSWTTVVRVRGRRHRVTLGSVRGDDRELPLGIADARERCRDVQRDAGKGITPEQAALKGLTVKDLCGRALAGLVLRPSTRAEWERLAEKEIEPALGNVVASALSRGEIREWGLAITAGQRPWKPRAEQRAAPTTAIAAFELLRRCYSWALERDFLAATPFVSLPKPGQRNQSSRVLDTDELRAVWQALNRLRSWPEWRVAAKLLLLTVSRREMVAGLVDPREVQDLDGKDPRWTIPAARMKGARDHTVPLAPAAVVLIRERLASGRRLEPQSQFTRRLKRKADAIYRHAMGLPKRKRGGALVMPRWTLHGFRHSAATHMVEDLGIDPVVVSLLLAHRPVGIPAVTNIYLRAYRLKERRAALTKWAAWLEALD